MVYYSCQDTFARARRARHQYCRLTVCNRLYQVKNLRHLVIVTEYIFKTVFLFELQSQALVFAHKRLLFDSSFNRQSQFIINDGFCKVLVRAPLNSFDRT